MNDSEAKTSKSVLDSADEESIQKKSRISADDILDDISFKNSLNSIISNCKITRTPNFQNAWGCIQFYENSRLVYTQDLWSTETTEVSKSNLLKLNESPPKIDDNSNFLMNYWDWAHIIDNGFSLTWNSNNTLEMKVSDLSDDSCRYKIFTGDNEIAAHRGKNYEIYNSTNMIKELDKVTNLKSAYDSKKYCYIIIAIYGQFMKSFGAIFNFDNIKADMVASMPYWFLIKINKQFIYLDNKIKSNLKKI